MRLAPTREKRLLHTLTYGNKPEYSDLMTFSTLRKICLPFLLVFVVNCSGETTSDYNRTITFQSKNQVVQGLVYGYGGKSITGVTGSTASPPLEYTALHSGQFAIINYPLAGADKDTVFYASFNDNSRLHSVWSGVPTPAAHVTVVFENDDPYAVVPAHVTVSPDKFEARANINPLTDLAYWYWQYDNRKSPYSYYLTSVFWFFNGMYFIPEQNLVHDYPSPQLTQLLDSIQIKIAPGATGFSLISNATGKTVCEATFAQFPICN